MATHGDFDKQTGLDGNMKEKSFKGSLSNKERDGKHTHPRPLKASYYHNTNGKLQSPSDHTVAEHNGGDSGGVVSFSTNHNSVVCLPLVSEGLKLVWTQSDQTRELDTVPELVQAFNVFPYPTSRELSNLACLCALPLDKVKVWFMVQRIKYGISWTSEEIEETRRKLAGPERISKYEDEGKTEEDKELRKGLTTHCSPQKNPAKRPRYDPPESPNPPSTPKFRSSLPPPQDSYYYRHPVDVPAITATSPGTPESPLSLQQQRQGRYKKSKAQLALLRSSFLRENWPNEAELRRLQEETGLSRNDIRKWFSDSRYQLRNGRAGPGITSTPKGGQVDPRPPTPTETQQLQPLPLVAHKPRDQENEVTPTGLPRGKVVRNGAKESDFFKNFLSNRLEAFGEGTVAKGESDDSADEPPAGIPKDEPVEPKAKEEAKKEAKEEMQSDEDQPLKLIREPSEPEAPTALPTNASSPSPSATPPPASAALPHKRSSTSGPSSQKTASSAKANPPVVSSPSSPHLTAAGRPRKTKEQLDVLKQHFLSCQWPTSEDYTQLVELTGLPRADVIQWFGDTRYAVKNGQLRWVRGVREQILAEIALQQNGGGAGGNSSSGVSRGGSRKRRSQGGNTTKAPAASASADSPDIKPLESYHQQTGVLQEKDLDALCRKSRMSYQQVREWFASQKGGESQPSEPSVTN
ncbi:homeobox and leucine zipper encoding a [Clupea harengus]|uniref:Homeobox and leucine zipper encoding a n=1 Tax=Clupea harengus TaxID=7950 RepID=A0A6P3W6N5_CLUHA|nr:homeobox and leucine zipper encoding a [Clupea harengus]XP_012690721.1 homeobox and leucine zipper encoding a [Clupea harengus]XP_031415298.1 homeobox and leucine zipper encoding a [Clupea harengus]